MFHFHFLVIARDDERISMNECNIQDRIQWRTSTIDDRHEIECPISVDFLERAEEDLERINIEEYSTKSSVWRRKFSIQY